MLETKFRTNTCGELNKSNVKQDTVLAGWCHSRRDHGGLIFVDLRDRYGLTQVVFNPESKEAFKEADKLRREDVIQIKGKVVPRKPGMENPKLPTGDIEVEVIELNVLNKAETPPIEIDDRTEANEDLRLKYRYLDLRRPVMANKLMLRNRVAQATREYLNSMNFVEVETPLLIRATPEGARDYIVPSRTRPGKFFALPQSPQLYKQILMVSGMDRYFQLAKCLRDEDLRADRQPEFTQIDMEMSFIDEEDVYKLCEGLVKTIWKKGINVDLKIPFPRMTYQEAMEKYGSDKPDLRFGVELIDITEIATKSDFEVFKKSDVVKCICVPAELSRNDVDKYTEFAQKLGAKGMVYIKVTEKGLESSVVKYFKEEQQKQLVERTGAKTGNTLLIIADRRKKANEILGQLRLEVGKNLSLIVPGWKFIWITKFPLFEYNEEEQIWTPMHHIFSTPHEECIKYLEEDPGMVTGKLYDLALNGIELGGGSIRIHKKELQEKVLKVIGMTYEQAEKRFGFLLNSFRYGAPPHGGLAFGLDRICALMSGTNDIREVIAFPKNKNAECPMDECPSDVEPIQLKELHIKIDIPKKK